MLDPKTYRSRIKPTSQAKLRAKELRQSLTEPERLVLWSLRTTNTNDPRFRIQKPLGPYIADFYCHAARLVVEIDGKHHQGQQQAHDQTRDAWMQSCSIKVVRINAADVYSDLEVVRSTMISIAQERIKQIGTS